MTSDFEIRAKNLAKLPRAERFDQLLEFPTQFTFKAIGRGAEFSSAVRSLLEGEGLGQTILVERPSAKGTFLSVAFTIRVENGAAVDRIYTLLEALESTAYLL